MTMTTNLADEHPLVKAADAKLADLEKRRSDFETRVAVIAEQDQAAQAVYDTALNDHLLRGIGPMPPPLVRQLPELADVEQRHLFIQEEHRLTEERLQAVAGAYGDVLEEARGRAAELLDAARPAVEQLMATMREVGELLAAVNTCRTAANAVSPEGRLEFHDSPLTVEAFVRLVATSSDPIGVLDLAGNRDARPRGTGMLWGDIQQLIDDTGVRTVGR